MGAVFQAHLHGGDPEALLKAAFAVLDRAPGRVGATPTWLLNALDSGHRAVGAGLAMDDRQAVLRGLRAMRDASAGVLAVTFRLMRDRPLTVDGKRFALPETPVHLASPDTWMRGFFAGLVLRDEASTRWFVEVPGKELLDERVRARPYAYVAVDALRGMRVDANGWQRVLATSRQWASEDPELQPYDKAIVLPMLAVLDRIYAGVPALDEALVAALEAHKAWYSEGDGKGDERGIVALGPLALGVWAHSCGLTPTVESDYLPTWLLTTRWS
ncbi:MAG: immunity 49 family protein [Alphaproteobacteria bacterium]|nr:immunity 49 family protein [Alphaproteobacteria bacterium]MCB9691267.1 immunity 49 family protein [Alphaproteobacteria bacterium]